MNSATNHRLTLVIITLLTGIFSIIVIKYATIYYLLSEFNLPKLVSLSANELAEVSNAQMIDLVIIMSETEISRSQMTQDLFFYSPVILISIMLLLILSLLINWNCYLRLHPKNET